MAAGDLITTEWQLEWRGMMLGYPASSVAVTDLSGWLSRPTLRSQSSNRPGRHGTRAGQQRAAGRLVEVELTVIDDDVDALRDLREACYVDEAPAEEPLVIWAGTDEPQMVTARIERMDIPTDHEFSVGHHRATIQWAASDPRRYGLAAQSAMVGLPSPPVDGLEWPAEFPLDFGMGRSAGEALAANDGDAASWPVLTVTGPAPGPIIREVGGPGLLVFAPSYTVSSTQQMVIDTDARTVMVGGVSRRDQLVTAQWFPLPRKSVTRVGFDAAGAYSPAAHLTVSWRSAWM